MSIILTAAKETIINQAVSLVMDELDKQASDVVNLRNEFELENTDLLSTNLIANKSIHQTIKNKIIERSSNIGKIVAGTAFYIEEEKLNSMDEAVARIQGSAIERRRLVELTGAQKKISVSYSTLSAVIEIYKRANKSNLDAIKEIDRVDNSDKRIRKSNLILKNSIIVYELTNFIISQIEQFGLHGLDELHSVRDEVLHSIDEAERFDKKRMKDTQNSDMREEIRQGVISDIKNKEIFRERVKDKWREMIDRVSGIDADIKKARGFVSNMRAIRDTAASHIQHLNILATTQIVDSSINSINELSMALGNWELPALDERAAYELLNIEHN